MFDDKRILAFIPARGGSKGIPHKNIMDLCGKPLISYTIEAARESKYIDYIMVSTDDMEIAEIAREYGAKIPFMRPEELASDKAKTLDAVLNAIRMLANDNELFDELILLQPTGPLRTSSDIDCAIEVFFENDCQSLASVNEVDDHPILIRTIDGNALRPIINALSTCRRQDLPKYYRVNGCIYINTIDDLDESTSFNDNKIAYLMKKSHSVDVDEMSDIALAEYYLRNEMLD